MNFDAWVEQAEASRISSEPILQRYFERPIDTREPTEDERRQHSHESASFGPQIESLEQAEAAFARERARKRERNLRRQERNRQARRDRQQLDEKTWAEELHRRSAKRLKEFEAKITEAERARDAIYDGHLVAADEPVPEAS